MLQSLTDINVVTTRGVNPKYKVILAKFPDILHQLELYTSFLLIDHPYILKERICCTIHNITKQPECPECHSPLKFQSSGIHLNGYLTFCSPTCAQQSNITKQTKQNTCMRKYSVMFASQSVEIKNKITDGFIKKYGCHPRQTDVVKQKQITTNLERYGHEYPQQSEEIQKKIKATNIERYGHENPLQSEEIKEKIKNTLYSKYGGHHLMLPRYQNKQSSTNILRYGVAHVCQIHMVDCISLLNDYEWVYDQYLVQNKTADMIANYIGVSRKCVLDYVRKHNIAVRPSGSVSIIGTQYLNSLNIPHLIHEWDIPGTRYKADGYDPNTNTIYEFHGDYWHGNPRTQDLSKTFHGTMTLGDLYDRTKIKESAIIELGYKLVVMWEADWYARQFSL